MWVEDGMCSPPQRLNLMFIDNRSMPGFGILFLDVGKFLDNDSLDFLGIGSERSQF